MMMEQKLNYIHNNPVKAMLVHNPEDYVFSSAVDYVDGDGLVKVTLVSLLLRMHPRCKRGRDVRSFYPTKNDWNHPSNGYIIFPWVDLLPQPDHPAFEIAM